jgi:hypothetical protein
MKKRPIARRALLGSGLLTAGALAAGRGRSVMAAPKEAVEEITNGLLAARISMPDARGGFYSGTRFDWSGVLLDLEYAGHHFYGPWFDRIDPPVHDFAWTGPEIVAGRASAVTGPAQEFVTGDSALGYDEAGPGGTFVKIGVGALRKPGNDPYDRFGTYEFVDRGAWTADATRTAARFIHDLRHPDTGYGYRYEKRIRLVAGRSRMVMAHRLRNTGTKPIRGEVYNHNFLVLDRQPTGPDFEIHLPFAVKPEKGAVPESLEVRGGRIGYRKKLDGQDVAALGIEGFGASPRDYDIRVENRKVSAGYRVTADRPLSRLALWSIRSTLCMEPFIRTDVEPGSEITWSYIYDYYTLPR